MYPFVHDVSYITVATMGMEPFLSGVMGNVLSSSYAPSLWTNYVGPLTFWQRLENTVQHILPSILWKHWTLIPLVQREVSETELCISGVPFMQSTVTRKCETIAHTKAS